MSLLLDPLMDSFNTSPHERVLAQAVHFYIRNYSIIGQVSIDELIIYFVTQIETFVPLSIAP
jgi:hypothetical protein